MFDDMFPENEFKSIEPIIDNMEEDEPVMSDTYVWANPISDRIWVNEQPDTVFTNESW